jgi:hypothetical protein
LEVNNYGVGNFYFLNLKMMLETCAVPHTCVIVDLVTGQAVHVKRGRYLMDSSGPDIHEITIVSGLVRVDNGEEKLQFTIVRTPSPDPSPLLITSGLVVSSAAVSEEVESNVVSRSPTPPVPEGIPFLPPPLLRPTVHVILDDDSRTPSPPVVLKKKGKKEKKRFKY